jgi:hypothetical protein
VSRQLARFPGVDRIEANPATAGILVVPAVDSGALARFAEAEGLFQLSEAGAVPMTITETLAGGFSGLNRELRRVSDGSLDLGSLAFAALVIGAIVQWRKGHVLGPASTLLWYAAGLLLMTRAVKDRRTDS